jgi:glycosyltransferase involved in cell wall biosynthesis
MLFLRDLRPTKDGLPRISGAHVKIREYFDHALAHPALTPNVYFTPRSEVRRGDLWGDVPPDRVLQNVSAAAYDIAVVSGKDWMLLPPEESRVIHYLQSLEQCEPGHPRFGMLRRPAALRICASEAIGEASRPHRAGPAVVITNGISLDLFRPRAKRPGSVLIWGHKDPNLATDVRDLLASQGVGARLLTGHIQREDFARLLSETEVFVGVPRAREGFYLPGLEAMAAGCAVICPDAVGNRAYCIDEGTSLTPRVGDARSYAGCVQRLIDDTGLAEGLRRRGIEIARGFSLEQERSYFHKAIDEFVIGREHAHRCVS